MHRRGRQFLVLSCIGPRPNSNANTAYTYARMCHTHTGPNQTRPLYPQSSCLDLALHASPPVEVAMLLTSQGRIPSRRTKNKSFFCPTVLQPRGEGGTALDLTRHICCILMQPCSRLRQNLRRGIKKEAPSLAYTIVVCCGPAGGMRTEIRGSHLRGSSCDDAGPPPGR